MQTQTETSWREDFVEAVRGFEEWRATRPRGARIPEHLWQSATALAERHGVARTATTLKLDYYGLKKHLGVGLERADSKAADQRPSARFVEVSLAGTTTCVLELEATSGTSKLRLELQGLALGQLEALVHSIWSSRPA